jgi:hypothetical protein
MHGEIESKFSHVPTGGALRPGFAHTARHAKGSLSKWIVEKDE